MPTTHPRRRPDGPGRRRRAASERGERTLVIGRPTDRTPRCRGPARRRPRRRGVARRGGRRQRRRRARRRRPAVRDRDDRLGRPARRGRRRAPAVTARAPSSAANFSLGVALFGRLVETATDLFGARRGVRPVPRRVASPGQGRPARPAPPRSWPAGSSSAIRASRPPTTSRPSRSGPAASPGMHLVGFDAAGETVELRITARDRAAYAAGVLAVDRLAPAGTASARHPRRSIPSSTTSCCRGRPRPPDRPSTDRPERTMRHDPDPLHQRPTLPPGLARRLHRARHPVHARTAPSTRRPSAGSSAGRSWPASTASSRAARPASRRPSPPPSASGSSPRPSRSSASAPRAAAIPVIAGTGTNDTAATIAATRRAAELGADAALVVAPYYNRPDGRMLEAHFRAVADEGDLPIVVYNVPSRTGTNVDAATFLRLAEHPRVIAVKEASGNLEQIARICRERPRDVAVLAGDDAWTLPILALGGDGVVSVASNEIPGELVALCAAAQRRRLGGGAPDPRALAAAVPRQLRGGPEPGPGEGRPGPDGPARRATPSARRCCRWTPTGAPRWPSPCARSAWSRPAAAGSGTTQRAAVA